MSTRLKTLFTLAVPVVAIAAGAFWMLDFSKRGPAGLVYETQDAGRGAIRKLVSTSGPVRALVTVSVGSQLSGTINELKVDFNSEVKPNDVMAVLDDKTFVAKVSSAKADLQAAEAQLINQQASLQKAEAVQRQAERVVGRTQVLAQKGISSNATMDTATRDADVATADIAVAKATIESAKAVVAQRKGQLEQAQIDLDRTLIRSPISGTVISRTIDVGQTVAASLQAPELFKIAQDLSRIRIEAQVNEADVGSVQQGNSVEFSVDAYPERKFQGKVTQVRLAATELQNIVTYTVIIEAANEDRKLFPGMTANVQIETAKRDGVLRVSNDALRYKPRDKQPAAPGEGARGGGQGGAGGQRMVEQLKDELQLTAEQAEKVQAEMRKFFQEMRAQNGGGQGGANPQGPAPGFGGAAPQPGSDMAGNRGRVAQRLEQVLQPLLTETQRPLFDKWKRGRESTRSGTLWVLAADGEPESRNVRLGIADEQFTEIVTGQLKEGEKIVVRAKEVKK